MASKVAAIALAGIIGLGLSGCGDDSEPTSKADETPAASPATTTEPAAEISDDCKLAVLNWETIASKQHADLVFGAADNAGDPAVSQHANEIETYCPKELNAKVAKINYDLAVAEAQLAAGNESTTKAERAALKDEIDAVSASVK